MVGPHLHVLRRNVVRDPGDLRGARLRHALVIRRIVRDVPRVEVTLQSANPVREPGRSRNRPRSGASLRIPHEGVEALRIGAERHGEAGQGCRVREPPRFRGVREVAVDEEHDRSHELRGQPHGFDRDLEAIHRRGSRHHGKRGITVAAVHGLKEIGLFGLGRHAGGRAGSLAVHHHQRQLGRHGEAQRFGLQRDPRPGARGEAERAGIGRTNGGADGGDLVFGLEREHAVFLHPGHHVQQGGGGSDGVRAEHQFVDGGRAGASDEAPGRGLRSRHRAVHPGGHI